MRRVACLLALPVVSALAGCPEAGDPCQPTAPYASGTDEEEPAVNVDGAASYGGLGNDEVWVTLYDAKARATTGGDAATLTSPAADEVLDGSGNAPIFTWESPLKIVLGPTLPSTLERPRVPSLLEKAFGRASRALIPSAHAHLPPVTSDAYLVEIAGVSGRQCPGSVVTTELSHQLDADTWAALQESKGTDLTITITSAALANGRVQEGPFASEAVTVRVE